MIPTHEIKTRAQAIWSLSRFTLETIRTSTKLLRAHAAGKNRLEIPEVRDELRSYGQNLCGAFDVRVTVIGEPLDTRPGIVVSNHMSYLDVPAILSMDAVSFVAKAEVRKMPFIGPAAEAFGVIFIDRKSEESRRQTGDTLQRAVLEHGGRVVVFPEGTTSLRGLPWRPGVFKLAQDHGLRMQAMSICYRPADRVAFQIPSMLEHALQLPKAGGIEAIITVGPSFFVTDFLKDAQAWESWSKGIISAELARQRL